MKAWVYFLRFGQDGPIKIGRTRSPIARMQALNMGAPIDLIMLGTMFSENADIEERDIHRRLESHRIRGEWFDATAVLEEI